MGFLIGFYMTVAIVLGACGGAVAYQQYIFHHPDYAKQEICTVTP